MLFQGQEFAASSPFFYFADHKPDLAKLVAKGRGEFLKQFRSAALPEIQAQLTDPADRQTFERSKLDLTERQKNAPIYALHRDLIRLRREDKALRAPKRGEFDGAVLGAGVFVLRYFSTEGDRLLVVNLGRDYQLDPAPEPLLAPPEGMKWKITWTSDDPRYGGIGTPALDTIENWRIPGQTTVLLTPAEGPADTIPLDALLAV